MPGTPSPPSTPTARPATTGRRTNLCWAILQALGCVAQEEASGQPVVVELPAALRAESSSGADEADAEKGEGSVGGSARRPSESGSERSIPGRARRPAAPPGTLTRMPSFHAASQRALYKRCCSPMRWGETVLRLAVLVFGSATDLSFAVGNFLSTVGTERTLAARISVSSFLVLAGLPWAIQPLLPTPEDKTRVAMQNNGSWYKVALYKLSATLFSLLFTSGYVINQLQAGQDDPILIAFACLMIAYLSASLGEWVSMADNVSKIRFSNFHDGIERRKKTLLTLDDTEVERLYRLYSDPDKQAGLYAAIVPPIETQAQPWCKPSRATKVSFAVAIFVASILTETGLWIGADEELGSSLGWIAIGVFTALYAAQAFPPAAQSFLRNFTESRLLAYFDFDTVFWNKVLATTVFGGLVVIPTATEAFQHMQTATGNSIGASIFDGALAGVFGFGLLATVVDQAMLEAYIRMSIFFHDLCCCGRQNFTDLTIAQQRRFLQGVLSQLEYFATTGFWDPTTFIAALQRGGRGTLRSTRSIRLGSSSRWGRVQGVMHMVAAQPPAAPAAPSCPGSAASGPETTPGLHASAVVISPLVTQQPPQTDPTTSSPGSDHGTSTA